MVPRLAFRAVSDDGDDLWSCQQRRHRLDALTTGNTRPTQIVWSHWFAGQIYFRDNGGNIRVTTIATLPGVAPTTIPFTAKMTVRRDELFLEMFDQSWRALNEHFYDSNFHGVNWKQVRAKYRPLVSHCEMKEDLYALISLMFGELNASHLGIAGNLATPELQTAELGLIFDHHYAGPGPEGRRGREGWSSRPGAV